MKTVFRSVSVLAVLAGATSLMACSEAKAPSAANKPAQVAPAETKVAAYVLTTCPISGEKLGSMGDPVVKTYEGEEVRFCCSGCLPTFEKDLAANVAKVKAAKAKAQVK